jgi:ribose transport system ATP-binding protein
VSATAPVVELAGISKSFGGVRALRNVDVRLHAGRTHVLLGENGAGKSTLIRVLTGAVTPDAGEIRIDGTAETLLDPVHARALGIRAVYQEPMIFPHLTVLENIFTGSEITGPGGRLQRRVMLERALPQLAELDLPPALLDREMGTLGLGTQQLVLIAQALVAEARVIIFDEPTSILSRSETDRLFAVIDRLRAGNRAIVYITHRLEEVPRIGDEVTVLTDGAVTGRFEAGTFAEERLLELMAGKSVREFRAEVGAHAAPPLPPGPPTLEIANLSHPTYFRNVSWQIPSGSVTGIYGLVGAGRSEVALCAFGLLRFSAGEVRLNGRAINPRDPAEAIGLGIGYLPEDRKLQGIFAPRALENNLTSNVLNRFTGLLGRLNFAGLHDESRSVIQRYAIKSRSPATAIGTLSGGNQQKGLFSRWASPPFKALILDEPTRGIDVRTKAEIHGFIRELAANGAAVAVISSDLAEIMAVSDRVIVMRGGSVVDRAEGERMRPERILAAAIGAASDEAA